MEHMDNECMCKGKRCKICKRIKCLLNFGHNGKGRIYTDPYCRPCNVKRVKEWKAKNAQRNRIAHRTIQRKYINAHPNKKSHLELDKRWIKNNPERYRVLNVSKRARRRTKESVNGGSYSAQEWLDLKQKYNYTCLCCGRQEPEIKLCADHVIPVIKHGSSNIENIQPLCRSCNAHKRDKTIDFR